MFRRYAFAAFLIIFVVQIVVVPAHAEVTSYLPAPNKVLSPSPAYAPVLLRGMKVDAKKPFVIDFILDYAGDQSMRQAPQSVQSQMQLRKLIAYFMAALTIPENDMWVNLSPFEKDHMIEQDLAQTSMGQEMLAQDYVLKQLSASLIYPENEIGKRFWKQVYQRMRAKNVEGRVSLGILSKIWITVDRAEVVEYHDRAFVSDIHLKVLLKEDAHAAFKYESKNRTAGLMSKDALQLQDLIERIILPQVEQQVNEGSHFAPLRQMVYAMVLASWYKMTLKDSLLNQKFANKRRVGGIVKGAGPQANQQIYAHYLQAYKKGVFNFIKDEVSSHGPGPQQRKYFAGGLNIFPQGPENAIRRQKASDFLPTSTDLAMASVLFKRSIRNGESFVEEGTKPVVLILADDADFVERMTNALSNDNKQVLTAHNINEAIEILASSQVEMPDGTSVNHVAMVLGTMKSGGLALMKGMDQNKELRRIPMVLVTQFDNRSYTFNIERTYSDRHKNWLLTVIGHRDPHALLILEKVNKILSHTYFDRAMESKLRSTDIKRVLVVDNDPHQRQEMKMKLERAGYQTIVVESVVAAMDKIKSVPIDLVLCDSELVVQNWQEPQSWLLNQNSGEYLLSTMNADLDINPKPRFLLRTGAVNGFHIRSSAQIRRMYAQDPELMTFENFLGVIGKSSKPEDDFLTIVQRELPLSKPVKNVLIVDDDPQQLKLMRLVLQRAGYLVLEAGSVDAAKKVFGQNHTIDLIISDGNLPDGNGTDILDFMGSNLLLGKIPFIYRSGYMDGLDKEGKESFERNLKELHPNFVTSMGKIGKLDTGLLKIVENTIGKPDRASVSEIKGGIELKGAVDYLKIKKWEMGRPLSALGRDKDRGMSSFLGDLDVSIERIAPIEDFNIFFNAASPSSLRKEN